MNLITYFPSIPDDGELPQEFPSPFDDRPHPLARQACEQLQNHLDQQTLWQHDFYALDGGKMFGVLVVRDHGGRIGFLAAFSGMLAGQWLLPGFVPPLFNVKAWNEFFPTAEAGLQTYTRRILALENNNERAKLQCHLDGIIKQRQLSLDKLRELHKQRKIQRHKQRAGLLEGVAGRDETLLRLSFESQQDRRELRIQDSIWDEKLAPVTEALALIDKQIYKLKQQRQRQSRKLHKQVFASYILTTSRAEKRPLADFFDNKLPPGGAGDCAGPKLLQYAHLQGLRPLAMAEFWWGESPADGVRKHGQFYPSCRGKCAPILPFMLDGIAVKDDPVPGSDFNDPTAPETIFEDDQIVVVNKPSGLLSVPGKTLRDSVLTRLQQRYPDASGPLLVHRLDMATSGLLLVAKNPAVHKMLQQQFLKRTIEKRYVAVLSRVLDVSDATEGVIDLPIRVDLDDRPRQLVCHAYGKAARTRWQLITQDQRRSRVYFYPVNGRTHQLRVHAAHKKGLNAAIVGDELYGKRSERLLLHAERLCFSHPVTGRRIEVEVAAPF